MKKLFTSVLLISAMAVLLTPMIGLPVGVTFFGLFILAYYSGKMAKQGSFTFDTLAPEIATAIENVKSTLAGQIGQKAKEALQDNLNLLEKGINDLKAAGQNYTELQKNFDELKEKFDKNQELIDEMQKDRQRQKEANENREPKTFKQALKDAIQEQKANINTILQNKGRQDGPLVFEVKAAVTIGMDNTILDGDSASHYTLTSNTGIISTIRKRIMTYLQNVSTGQLPIERPYAMWIEELDEQGNPIFIGEGVTKTQLSVRYEEREMKAKKIAVFGKVTTEFLRYLPQLVSYINNNLIKRMDIATENGLFNGDGTGDNLTGLTEYATEFDGGVGVAGGPGLVGAVPNANNYDVIKAIQLQVFNSYGVGSVLFVKPEFEALMVLQKDNEGRYLMPPFVSSDGTRIAGMKIVPTNALSALDIDFIGGDMSVVNVHFLEQSRIQVGLDGNDFTNNKKTILAEQQLVQFVSANDTQVLVQGTFAEAIALINSNAVPAPEA